MPQENVERAYQMFDAMNRGDLKTPSRSRIMRWRRSRDSYGVEGGDSYHGHEGVREWWETIFSAFPDFNATVLEVRAVADATISNIRFQGSGAESEVPFDETIWQVVRWRDGKVIWVKSYRDRAEALEAAELSK